ncbi:hypothetical protein DUNSADRAFT_17042 [Dunaliella salina]|uniref:F-box domain-containing protein n=1 Tax=Dunaliella salina TaxID=3046 RepID=A0ABQ7H0H9_DUNSA|nr:hypothetical protein DUNSADRAFT_17042 [Dunaliella salina]|eukprot:KAF5840346.1 hypothetical protein DUNSADRAFT_17042 [Dunaliella salina]
MSNATEVLCSKQHLLRRVLEGLNPGEACKMALVCKQWHDAVTNRSDLYWRDQCIKVGFWNPPESRSPDCATDNQWFFYFAKRMICRVRIRNFFLKYVAFLPRTGQLAFNPGASLPELDQTEHKLGVRMPWELWELYRYRNGQSPASGVFWTDDTRLLCLSELQLEHRELGSNHKNFRTTAMESLLSAFPLSCFPLSKDQNRPPPPGWGRGVTCSSATPLPLSPWDTLGQLMLKKDREG